MLATMTRRLSTTLPVAVPQSLRAVDVPVPALVQAVAMIHVKRAVEERGVRNVLVLGPSLLPPASQELDALKSMRGGLSVQSFTPTRASVFTASSRAGLKQPMALLYAADVDHLSDVLGSLRSAVKLRCSLVFWSPNSDHVTRASSVLEMHDWVVHEVDYESRFLHAEPLAGECALEAFGSPECYADADVERRFD